MADASKKEDLTAELIPPEGREEVGEKVFEILEAILADKERLGLTGANGKFIRNYEMVRGKHWKSRPTTNVPLVTANLVHIHMQRTVNALTDNNPTFNLARLGEDDSAPREAYEMLQRCAEYWWTEHEQQKKLETSVRKGETYGITIEKVNFNPDAEYGMGEAETVNVDPFYFGWYPVDLADIAELQKSEAVLYFRPMSVREARHRWPEKAKFIKADDDIIKDLGDSRREVGATKGTNGRGAGVMSRIGTTIRQIIHSGDASKTDEDQVLVIECWAKDYTEETVKRTETVDLVDPATGMVTQEEVEIEETLPKYKGNIRYICCCNGGDVVLEDRGNPNVNEELADEVAQRTYLYDKFPFCGANSVEDDASAWGCSDIEQLEELAKEFNKAISQLVLEKDRSARKKLVNPMTSGVRNEEFTNAPGIINPVNSMEADAIRFLDYPTVPADIQNSINLFKELFFMVAGTFELEQAQTPGREVIAYKAIAALLERAATMMRGKLRSYSRLIRERGRMYISMVQNFYTEDRYLTYTDETGMDITKKFRGNQLIIPARLSVVSGSTMPVSKVQQREEALTLFGAQAIDQEDLLEKLDWSGRTDVIQRRNKGVFGRLSERLKTVQMPEQIIQFMGMVSELDDKKFEKAVQFKAIPSFPEFAQTMKPEGPQQPDPATMMDLEEKKANIAKIYQEVQKIEADKALVIEKIATEQIEREVKIMGMQYDKEELAIRRAEIVGKIKSDMEKATALDRKGAYQEKGLKSNNEGD